MKQNRHGTDIRSLINFAVDPQEYIVILATQIR